MAVQILTGDCRQVLATLPAESVHCVVTSPPYFGLRSYLPDGHPDKAKEIGLEETPAAFVAEMVAVFREVRRVLRADGTLWLNLGDSYAGSWGNQGRKEGRGTQRPINGPMMQPVHDGLYASKASGTGTIRQAGLKRKDRMMIPARVAIALQDDGWWLRDEIIWSKPNAMPSSVEDRTTPAHEMVYMLSKSAHYHYDLDAIKEPAVSGHSSGNGFARPQQIARGGRGKAEQWTPTEWRQPRSVWTIATRPYAEAHFATMAPDLAERCIKAGCPAGGTVLDPFGGAGTTGLVADRLGRDAILIDLNPEFQAMTERRIAAARSGPSSAPKSATGTSHPDLPLFAAE